MYLESMTKNILISGGTGLVGKRLQELLESKGHHVSFLSRKKSSGKTKTYLWDVQMGYMEAGALENTDVIVHLAGAGVFDKSWTKEYKKEILDSRVLSTKLLCNAVKSTPNKVETFISASAIGIYGADTGDELLTEESKLGNDFLANVTKEWEASVDLSNTDVRRCTFRIGIVLSSQGGALASLAKPIKNFVGAPLGNGNQFVSWIHIDDLCNMIIQAIENEKYSGVYNAVAPNPVTNKFLTQEIAKTLKKPIWLPNVPAFILKFILGAEKALILLGGNKVSSKKIENAGFHFTYSNLTITLRKLFGSGLSDL